MINISELIVVDQLPVIRERLEEIKAGIENKVSAVLALDCNESTVKAIKVLRADLNKDLAELEERRKYVKKTVMSPYEKFEEIYKDCVSNVFKSADAELKRRIAEVEDEVKSRKQKEVQAYFEEYRESKHIDFVTFEQAGIKIGLSSSIKSLKETAKAFIDRITDDLKLIDTQVYREEILVEYKETLNVSASITSVTERHKAIEAERVRLEEAERVKREEQQTVEKVQAAVGQPLTAPASAKKVYRLNVQDVKAIEADTKEDLRILTDLLGNGKYKFIR